MMYIRHYRYNKLAFLLYWSSGVKRKALIFLCMLITVFSTVVGCSDNSTNNSSLTPFFPVQRAGLSQMDSLLEGKLVLDNGCLRVDDNYNSYLIIWPHGFSLRIEGEEIQVIDSNGKVVAHVGDEIYVGGGGGGENPGDGVREFIEESVIEQPLPDDCPGPYWIVGETVKTVN